MSPLQVKQLAYDRLGAREVLAFGAIYVLWGATFLAIRVAVLQLPPFLTAGLRFFTAGVILYGWTRARGQPRPTLPEWRHLLVIALCMFVLTYGPLFWAAQYVPSGVVAIIEASLPITTVILEVFVFMTQPLQWRLAVGVALGFAGVALLLIHNSGQNLAVLPCLVILAAGIAWSLGAVLSSRLTLPSSRPLCAGAEMLLGGVILLLLSASTGELHPFPHIPVRAAFALAFLIVFGSLVAYTCYVWLLGRFSVTQVSSHAYVNPVVAIVLGHFVAGEIITGRSIAASMLIVVSVFLLLSGPSKIRRTPLTKTAEEATDAAIG
jgi:drug/metabolite transporter (DMT)-like permease